MHISAMKSGGRRKIATLLAAACVTGVVVTAQPASATAALYSRCNSGSVYFVNNSGALYWYGDSAPGSSGGLTSGVQIGSGWSNFASVIAGGAVSSTRSSRTARCCATGTLAG
jgi:hypothetical protein